MKKSVLILISLLCFSFSKAQLYTENLPFDTTLYSGHYIANSFCSNPVQVRIEFDSSLYTYVTGMQFFIIIDSVNFPGPLGMSPVQQGDTFALDAVTHIFSTQIINGLEYWFRIKLVGTPTLVNETYPCKLQLDQCTCFCTYMTIRASTFDISSCVVGLSSFVSELNESKTISVFPNPAGKILTIKGIEDKATVFLYNVSGRLVLESEVSHDNVIDIANLSSGLYWISVRSEKQNVIGSLLVIEK